MTTDNLLAQLDRQTSNADEWRKEAARALSLLDDANKQIAVLRSPARRGSDDVDDEAERLFWCFAAMLDPSQTGNAPLSQRDAFKRAIRPSLCAATKEVNDSLRAQLAERTRELEEAKAEARRWKARAKDAEEEIDGRGRSASTEAMWKERQGDDYGSY